MLATEQFKEFCFTISHLKTPRLHYRNAFFSFVFMGGKRGLSHCRKNLHGYCLTRDGSRASF